MSRFNRFRGLTRRDFLRLSASGLGAAAVGASWRGLRPYSDPTMQAATAGGAVYPFVDQFGRPDGPLGPNWIAPSWALVDGVAQNTPVLLANQLANPNFDTWTDPNTPQNWRPKSSGSSMVNRDDSVYQDAPNSCRLDVDSSNSSVYVQQAIVAAMNTYFLADGYIETSGPSISGRFNIGANGQLFISQGAFAHVYNSFLLTADNPKIWLTRGQAASGSVWWDKVGAGVPKLPTLFSFVKAPLYSDSLAVTASWQVAVGTHAGVILCADDPLNPQNYLLAVIDRSISTTASDSVQLIRFNAGVAVEVLVNATTTALDFVHLSVRRTDHNTFELWYHDAKLGVGTVTDAKIVNNGWLGKFSTGGGSACSYFESGVLNGSLTLDFVGGSITNGAEATQLEAGSWRALVTKWEVEAKPGLKIVSINSGVGGTPSFYGLIRFRPTSRLTTLT